MGKHRFVRLVSVLLVMLVTTGCIDELMTVLEIIAYGESDDPEIQKTGEVIQDIKEENEVRDALDKFAETRDPRYLEAARALRPNDTGLKGYDLVLAQLGGDPAQIEAAQKALALAEAQRLASLNTPDYQFETTAEQLRRNVLGELLVAQTNLLGGSLSRAWDAPGPDASPETHLIFEQYCGTRAQIMNDFNDDLSYLPPNPCPPS